MRHKTHSFGDELGDRLAGLPVPRIAENGYRLPDPLPTGSILTDSTQRQWLLGESIGCGGFGEIYCAKELPESQRFGHNSAADRERTDMSSDVSTVSDNNSYNGLPKRSCVQKFNERQTERKNKEKLNKLLKDSNYPFVVKVDHISGPLFAEMHFYHRVAKPKLIDNWMLTQRLAFIGMPRYVASGIFIANNTCRRYRFLVLDRLGIDLQKILNKQNNRLSLKSAYTITMMTIDILAYIHSFGYIHADIKASNLLLGRLETTSPARELYLVDYGLVERYRTQDGEHKEEEEDNRRANSGTIEFTSRDGHVGALTRRSDLEILAFNTISWLSGARLPWIDCKDHEIVRKQKEYYMSHMDELLKHAFHSKSLVPKGLEEFVRSISRLGFKEDPDYSALKLILTRAIVSSGSTNDGLITWGEKTVTKTKTVKKGSKRAISSSVELGRGKAHRGEKQEFEQFELCDIPRKMDRHRAVRSAPTTLSRQRSASITPTNTSLMDLSNPTPQMLEVMERMRQKSETTDRDVVSIDSSHCNNHLIHKKRIRSNTSTKKGSKAQRIPLQKLEINVKTTNTSKRCSNRTIDTNVNKKALKAVLKRKSQQQHHKKINKTLITRSKTKTILSAKKLIKRSTIHSAKQNRTKVALVVDLANGSFKCDKHSRNNTNGNKKMK
ncbi:unnamed protein product [Oppiella nova]|uniref:non-specific serine/threonine protein kinase n=1 Tax=Oppiella nova TaxID=334625 RepID=A0A7R9QCA5_9ACAR|nr:unnamed protein product [Oppiella nova]CAG2163057.1 unnamed protein product [Oppiella nova]